MDEEDRIKIRTHYIYKVIRRAFLRGQGCRNSVRLRRRK
jgi:hypothetical protein